MKNCATLITKIHILLTLQLNGRARVWISWNLKLKSSNADHLVVIDLSDSPAPVRRVYPSSSAALRSICSCDCALRCFSPVLVYVGTPHPRLFLLLICGFLTATFPLKNSVDEALLKLTRVYPSSVASSWQRMKPLFLKAISCNYMKAWLRVLRLFWTVKVFITDFQAC